MKAIAESGKCFKIWRPKTIFLSFFLVMFSLFLCSILISDQYTSINGIWDGSTLMFVSNSINCRKGSYKRCSRGTESLPRGIVEDESDMELKPLWSSSKAGKEESVQGGPKSLLAMAVGIHQISHVDQIARKFPASSFKLMLFHYDGVVDAWSTLSWFATAVHIVAINQTKWWFAKRFMHPDVVASYEYVFLWDEDLGVEHFNSAKYLDIVKEEGLEISQPALDPVLSSEIHHHITIKNKKTKVHRRIYRNRGKDLCSENSTRPPCTGWVEMMAPVFTRSAWRCAWHLIQNDLIHGWGMDMKLGYCAQGNPTRNVGVVDTQYLIHRGIPSLGGGLAATNKLKQASTDDHMASPSTTSGVDARVEIRKRAQAEMQEFKERWKVAVTQDKCWIDPYNSQQHQQGQQQQNKLRG